MTLSAAEFAVLAAELAAELPGARVQKLFLPEPRVALLELRLPGRSVLLLLDVEPGAGRISVVEQRPVSPSQALAAQGQWRSHLTGARLDGVESLSRGMRLRFSTGDGARSVVVEADRRGGDLCLLDAADRVLGVTPGENARARGLVHGSPYQPPEEVAPTGRNRLADVVEDGRPLPLARAVEAMYGTASSDRRLTETRAAVVGPLKVARRKLARTIGKVREDRGRVAEAEGYRRLGDLLKPILARVKRGDPEVIATDYGLEGAREVVVPLLPHLGPRENMERYYHLHRRLTRGAGRVEERLDLLEGRLVALDRLIDEATGASEVARLEAIHAEARSQSLLRELPSGVGQREGTASRRPFRELFSAAGLRLWVGRNAQDNDALTFRWARGNDLWLHARGQTGSHVVVPGVSEQGPDGETLLDAAELAAHFSAARGEGFVEVASTRCKYVRKPKGGPPGAVTFSQERTIALRREPERLARLLATEGVSAPGTQSGRA